ncbi:YdeI/OmpD-associated family protein [Maribacter sp. 2-571]|uniref:YdeI/OmpD-associated family protein n=1 Tax=Maribacter sp. 2-571 TaxID=3417569 RepID=UPI003D359419
MENIKTYYFKNDSEWRNWLKINFAQKEGIFLIFYKIAHEKPSMRWEEAVKVALCYGWIDSTVKSLGDGKRRQYFCPRKPKSVWSKLNKGYIETLTEQGLMHESGYAKIALAKEDGSWTALDDVENGIVPQDLQKAFEANSKALEHFDGFTRGQRKNYLYWLNQAKRPETRQKRIAEIIRLSEKGITSRTGGTR